MIIVRTPRPSKLVSIGRLPEVVAIQAFASQLNVFARPNSREFFIDGKRVCRSVVPPVFEAFKGEDVGIICEYSRRLAPHVSLTILDAMWYDQPYLNFYERWERCCSVELVGQIDRAPTTFLKRDQVLRAFDVVTRSGRYKGIIIRDPRSNFMRHNTHYELRSDNAE